MDVGIMNGSGRFTFNCQPGNHIVGYGGIVGQDYIGSITFVQRHEPAATGEDMPADDVR
jgi:hypothetical protein